MATQRRAYKVGERIQAVVAQNILKISDPRLSLVTVTSVLANSDLRQAMISWTVHGGEEKQEEAQAALNEHSKLLRKFVARELQLKFAPELRFEYDATLDYASKMDTLFEEVARKSSLVEE